METIFPTATHARHLITVLQVEEMMRQKADKDQASTVTMAKAVNRLAREHEKSRKAEDRQETSSDEDTTEKWAYDHHQAMKQYNLQKIPQSHSLKLEKQENMPKGQQWG